MLKYEHVAREVFYGERKEEGCCVDGVRTGKFGFFVDVSGWDFFGCAVFGQGDFARNCHVSYGGGFVYACIPVRRLAGGGEQPVGDASGLHVERRGIFRDLDSGRYCLLA